jgi:hypothetical protein
MVQMLRISTSAGNLNTLIHDESVRKMIPRSSSTNALKGAKGKMVYAVQTKSPVESHFGHENEEAVTKPKDFLMSILEARGLSIEVKSHESLAETYVKGNVAGYSAGLMVAVREGDLDSIRKVHESGKHLQCSNSFGESTVHAAARRGQAEILKFLVNYAGVSMRVSCDTGRTPLHDACWTGMPSFESVEFILEHCPDFLLTADKRGFTPLEYAPKDTHWEWK